MKTMYYVNGRTGTVSKHSKLECAEKSLKKVRQVEKYPTVKLIKIENGKMFEQIAISDYAKGWEETNNFFYVY